MTAQQQNAQGCQHATIAGSTGYGLLKGQCRDCGFQVYSESGSRLNEPLLDDLDRLRAENVALRAALDMLLTCSIGPPPDDDFLFWDRLQEGKSLMGLAMLKARAALAATPAETELAVLEAARRIAERCGSYASFYLGQLIEHTKIVANAQREAQEQKEGTP